MAARVQVGVAPSISSGALIHMESEIP